MASPYVFSYTFLDTNGVKASVSYYYVPTAPTTVTATQIKADWTALGTALDNASNAKIIEGKITLPEASDGAWKDAPVEENDVSDVIVLNLANAVTRYSFGAVLPNLKNVELSGGRVDTTQTDLAALIGFIEDGATNGSMTNEAGQDLTALNDAFQADRKHRRQLRARSLSEAAG